jgi:hypothetical protein
MPLKGGLVRKQMIQTAIEAIFADILIAKLKQIAKRRATIPIFGNVQCNSLDGSQNRAVTSTAAIFAQLMRS